MEAFAIKFRPVSGLTMMKVEVPNLLIFNKFMLVFICSSSSYFFIFNFHSFLFYSFFHTLFNGVYSRTTLSAFFHLLSYLCCFSNNLYFYSIFNNFTKQR